MTKSQAPSSQYLAAWTLTTEAETLLTTPCFQSCTLVTEACTLLTTPCLLIFHETNLTVKQGLEYYYGKKYVLISDKNCGIVVKENYSLVWLI